MCNLYVLTSCQQAIRAPAGTMVDRIGNLASMPGIFPDHPAPIMRDDRDGHRIVARGDRADRKDEEGLAA